MHIVWSFFSLLGLLINPRRALFSAASATDLDDESLAHSHLPEAHISEQTAFHPEFQFENINGEMHGVDTSEKTETNSEPMIDVEIFKELPEDDPKLAEFLLGNGHGSNQHQIPSKENSFKHGGHIHFNPSHSIDLLDERAHHLALVSKEQSRLEKQLMEDSANCEGVRRMAVHNIGDLQFNVSVLEMKLEMMKMARYQAEEQYQIMLYDFVECQKRMTISNFLKNETLKTVEKLNDSVSHLKNKLKQCTRKNNEVSTNVESMGGRLEESKSQLQFTLKSLKEAEENIRNSMNENAFLKMKLNDKNSEVDKVKAELNTLRNKLTDYKSSPLVENLKSDNVEIASVNSELQNQIDSLRSSNEDLKREFEDAAQILREELHECEGNKGRQLVTPKPSHNQLCTDARIDAAYNPDDSSVVIFKDEYVWVLRMEDEGHFATHSAHLINETFNGGPPRVDAAFQDDVTKQIYLFHDTKYWVYSHSGELLADFPKLIAGDKFPGVPNNVDAAFVWKENGRLYFVKGEYFWRTSGNNQTYVRYSINQHIAIMDQTGNVFESVDAVFEFDGSTIFVKGDLYYRFEDQLEKLADSDIPYPRLSCTWLFGCPASSPCVKKRRP